jgi:hypothetical protein
MRMFTIFDFIIVVIVFSFSYFVGKIFSLFWGTVGFILGFGVGYILIRYLYDLLYQYVWRDREPPF